MIARLALLLPLMLALTVGCGDDAPPSSRTKRATDTATPISASTPADTWLGTWRTLAPMPTPRTEVAVAALNGLVYVIGGFEVDGSASAKVEVYDPATDGWSEVTPLPEPRHHAAAVSYAPVIFVIGGFDASFADPVQTVFAYDPMVDSWTRWTDMPTPRGGLGADALDGLIYAVGGSGTPGAQTANEALNPATGEWKTRAPLPTGRDHLAVIAANGRVRAIGGRVNVDFNRNLNSNEAYHPDSWATRLPLLQTPRSGIAAATKHGWVFVFGGEGPAGTFPTVEASNGGPWMTVAPMPTARHGMGAAAVGDAIYVIGGGPEPGLSVTGANEVFYF